MDQTVLQGHKGGAGKQHTPVEEKNTLLSKSYAKVLLAIGEGEFAGNPTAEDIYLDGTPLKSAGGLENFGGVKWEYRSGRSDQSYITGVPDVSNEFAINLALTDQTPWTRLITTQGLDAVRITLAFPAVYEQKDNGDIVGYNIEYAIDLSTNGGAYVEQGKWSTNNQKTTVEYNRTHRINLTKPGTSWTVRIRRLTPNKNNGKFGDTMSVKSVAEVIDAKLRYPNTALLFVEFDAETFGGSSIPKISIRTKGRMVQVPSNYTPETRTYSGVWNGTFKWAWTNNPAWVFYDLVTNERFGLGSRITADMVDKWTLYQVSQYCDIMVPDGKGGTEPRYTCNIYIQSRKEAWQVLRDVVAIFNGMLHWSGTKIVATADMPVATNTLRTYNRSDVVDGKFTYGSTSEKTISTTALVSFDDPDNHFETAVEAVNDLALVQRYKTWNQAEIAAIGVTSRGQAQRKGKYQMLTNSLNRMVTFKLGLNGYLPRPGEVIGIADQVLAGSSFSGRISAATLKTVTCDRVPNCVAGDILYVNNADGTTGEGRTIQSVNGKVITVTANYSAVPTTELGWYVEKTTLKSQLYRITKVTWAENDAKFEVTGVQYEDSKYAAIDNGARLESRPITSIPAGGQDAPTGLVLSSFTFIEQTLAVTTLSVKWNPAQGAMNYEAQWRKDGGDWINVGNTASTGFDVKGIYTGAYQARVRAINAIGTRSVWTESANTQLNGKVGLPPATASFTTSSEIFGIRLSWTFPSGAEDTAYIQLQQGTTINGGTVAELTMVAYPATSYVKSNMLGGVSAYFRARLIDRTGNEGPWSAWTYGVSEYGTDKILEAIVGEIGRTELGQELLGELNTTATTLDQVKTDIATTKNDVKDLDTKVKSDVTAINTQITNVKNDLTTQVGAINTQITNVNTQITNNKTELNNQITAVKGDVTALQTSVNQSVTALTTRANAMDTTVAGLRTDIDAAVKSASYDATKTYAVGDIVRQGNRLYQALIAVPVNKTPPNATYWKDVGTTLQEAGATAAQVSTNTTTITNQGNTLTSHTSQLTGLTTRITDAETNISGNSTALSNLSSTVTQQGNTLTSQGQSITNLNASIGEVGGENLVYNPSFEKESTTSGVGDGWWYDGTGGTRTLSLVASTLNPTGVAQRADIAGLTTSTWFRIYSKSDKRIKVVTGGTYTYSMYIKATAGLKIRPQVYGLSSTGTATSNWGPVNSDATGNWQRMSVTFTVPSGTDQVYVSAVVYGSATVTGGVVELDQVQFETGSTVSAWRDNNGVTDINVSANASATSALTNRVTNAEGTITAQGTSLTNLTNRVTSAEGTLTSQGSAISGLTNTVTAQGGSITSQGTAITNLNATVGGIGGTGSNLLPAEYCTFGDTVPSTVTGSGITTTVEADAATFSGFALKFYKTSGTGTVYMAQTSTYAGSNISLKQKKYIVSLYARASTSGHQLKFGFRGIQANGTVTAFHYSGNVTVTDTWARYSAVIDMTASAADKVCFCVDPKSGTGLYNVNVWVDRLMVEEQVANGTEPSAFVIGNSAGQIAAQGSAIQTLTNRVTSAEGTITSQGQAITSLTNTVANKADSSALQALTSRVTSTEGNITSQGQSITQLDNKLTGSLDNSPTMVYQSVFGPMATDNWVSVASTGSSTATYGTQDGSVTPGVMIFNSGTYGHWWGESTRKIRFDATRTYKLTARVQQVSASTAGPVTYLGFNCFAEDGVTRINGSGQNNASSSHYVLMNGITNPVGQWVEVTSYVKGFTSSTENGGAGAGTSADPKRLKVGTVWFSPMVIANYNSKGGVTALDYFTVEDVTEQLQIDANASATQALTSRVSSAEGTITSQGSAITTLNNSLESVGGQNLLPNPSFDREGSTSGLADGWRIGSGLAAANRITTLVPSTLDPRGKAQRVDCKGLSGSAYVDVALPNASYISMSPGQIITISAYVRGTPGLVHELYLQYKNTSSATITTHGPLRTTMSDDWARASYTGTAAPAGTVAVDVLYRIRGPLSGVVTDGYYEIDRAQAEFSTVVTGWRDNGYNSSTDIAANATATQALTNRVTAAEGTITSQSSSITSLSNTLGQLGNSGVNLVPSDYSVFGSSVPAMYLNVGLAMAAVADSSALKGYALQATTSSTATGTVFTLAPSLNAVGCNMSFKNQKYIVSFYAKASVAGHQVASYFRVLGPDGVTFTTGPATPISLTTSWARYSMVHDLSNATTYPGTQCQLAVQANRSGVSGRVVQFDRFMVEPVVNNVAEPSVFSMGDSFDSTQANAAATTALTNRVTNAEGTITSQGSSITSLTNRISTAEGNITSQGSAISGLTSTVTAQGNTITSQGNSLTSLQSSLSQAPDNLILKGTFEDGDIGPWTNDPTIVNISAHPAYSKAIQFYANSFCGIARNIVTAPGEQFDCSADIYNNYMTAGQTTRLQIQFYDKNVASIGYYTAFTCSAGATNFQTYSGRITAPAGSVSARLVIRHETTTATGRSLWCNIVCRRVTAADSANADAITSLTTTVTNQGNTITSQGSAITNLTNTVSNKADSSAVQALTNRVTSAEGSITSQGSAITSLTATIGDTGSENLLYNSSFEEEGATPGLANYWWCDGSSGTTRAVSLVASSRSPNGLAQRADYTGLSASLWQRFSSSLTTKKTKVAQGVTYTASMYVRATPGLMFKPQVNGINTSGSGVSTYQPATTAADGTWKRYTVTFTPGTTTDAVYVSGVVYGTASLSAGYVEFDDFQLEVGSSASGWHDNNGVTDSAVAANASATQALTNRVSSAEGTLTTQSGLITQLDNALGDAGAENLCYNPTFTRTSAANANWPEGWYLEGAASNVPSLVTSWMNSGERAQRAAITGVTNGTPYLSVLNTVASRIKIAGNQTYTSSIYVRRMSDSGLLNMRLFIQFMNAAGTVLSSPSTTSSPISTDGSRFTLTATAPADAVQANVYYRVYAPTSTASNGTVEWARPQFETGSKASGWHDNGQGLASDIAATSSALSSLTSTVTQQGTTVTSQGQSITSLNNTVNGINGAVNLIPAEYAVYGSTNPTMNKQVNITMTTEANATAYNGYVLKMASTVSQSNYFYLSASSTDYPLKLKPSKSYILSFWVQADAARNMSARLRYKNAAGTAVEVQLASVAVTTTWTRVSAVMTTPAAVVGDAQIVFFQNSPAGTSTHIYDGFMLEEQIGTGTEPSTFSVGNSSRQFEAQASALSSLTNRVTAAEGTITSQGQSITSLNNTVANKADSSALAALTSRVSTAEGNITSQGSSVTTLQNQIGAVSGAGSNLLSDEYSWLTSTTLPVMNGSGASYTGVAVAGSASGFGIKMTSASTSTGTYVMLCPTNNAAGYNIPVEPGYYLVSFYASTPTTASVRIRMFASGVSVYSVAQTVTTTRTRYTHVVNMGTTSATVATLFYFNQTGVSGLEVTVDSVMVEKQIGPGTTASPFVAGPSASAVSAQASALSALTNRVTSAEGALTSASSNIVDLQNTIGTAGAFDPAPGATWNFDGSSTDGWAAAGATLTSGSGFVTITATGADPQFQSPSASMNVTGSLYSRVRAKITRRAGAVTDWDGILYYSTASHGWTSGYYLRVPNPNLAIGQSAVVEWDMSSLTVGGTDWINSTIQRIRIDFGATSGGSFEVDWVAVGRVAPSASSGALDSLSSTVTQQGSTISAQASSLSSLSTTVGGHTTSITTMASTQNSTNGKLNTLYSVKLAINSNGQYYGAGMGIGIENTPSGMQSQVLFVADRFAILNSVNGTASSPFVVQNGQTFIADAFINRATIYNAIIGMTTQSAAQTTWGGPVMTQDYNSGNVITRHPTRVNTYSVFNQDGIIVVVDGVLRVRMGIW